jgi:hypothetical protein
VLAACSGLCSVSEARYVALMRIRRRGRAFAASASHSGSWTVGSWAGVRAAWDRRRRVHGGRLRAGARQVAGRLVPCGGGRGCRGGGWPQSGICPDPCVLDRRLRSSGAMRSLRRGGPSRGSW